LLRLKEKGWQKGDSITYSHLMIEKGQYIKVAMTLEEFEAPGPGGAEKKLYKVIRSIENLPGVQSITWVDADLIPHKGQLIFPQIEYSLEEVSKEEAEKPIVGELVFLESARIGLKNPFGYDIEKFRPKVKSIVLLVKWANGGKMTHDLSGGSQKIIEGDLQQGLKIAIHRDTPAKGRDNPSKSSPQDMTPYLSPNRYIESDNGQIKNLAGQLKVAGSPWGTAIKIKNWVHKNIAVDFKTSLGSATEVLLARAGDCTEHAVLTAALCRAAGIPTRVALGYTLSFNRDREPIFIGHMGTAFSLFLSREVSTTSSKGAASRASSKNIS